MNRIIVDAIHNKEQLSLSYLGYRRIVEPHAYGCTIKGNEVLRCYQVQGGHTSDIPHNWELLSVSQIFGLSQTGEHFEHARPEYKRDDKAMSAIYAQL
jgi:hypothetical protein